MKNNIIYFILLVLIPFQYSKAGTNNEILLTDSRIKQYNEIAKEKFANFYEQLALLCDNSITDYSIKKELIANMLDQCADYNKLIKNDLQIIGLKAPNYSIADYLSNVSSANGNYNEKFILINTSINQDVKMYKKSGLPRYSFFIQYSREIIIGDIITDVNDKNSPKPVSDVQNMMLELSTRDGKQFVIEQFGIQNGNFDPLKNGYELVKPQQTIPQKNEYDQPHFIFNVKPATAKIFIDDMEIDYANGEKIPTTEGYHIVKVTADNYVEFKKQFNLRDTATKLATVILEKAMGYFSIIPDNDCSFGTPMALYKDVDDALSSLDEGASKKEKKQAKKQAKKPVFQGKIGIYDEPLEVGTYRLVVGKYGFKNYENTLTIIKDQKTSQTVQLIPSPKAWVNVVAGLACSLTLTTTSCGCCGNSGSCSMCNRTGLMPCYCCNGSGSIGDEQHSKKTCSTCGGDGKVTCKKCNGNGLCSTCNGRGHK